ncbi:FadR/GntR family transcriptional regulator [Vibrio gazogenes]|uniref:DNA-binding transcriptional regulator, FadR family n=2 Tax=Vibrio gazogenes TaxID=687 RepID=A0A1M4YS44_VIBGA|nr:FadR/GntR family transcriptional regulator [Vibrio gazogenes]USP15080.1 FadR family transcriptional regulator [Vibrio gazogenes]SHF08615.1 DNA-binding transcriptional regulator, FadR family [Vibrio gazogenes DSM 21264] [Vibrio gazogenes DSM 21264 = NBRC 103151]SJN56584.1 HTH-type transcriptional regulator LutR [Vibrio gazogenes]
MSYKLLDRFNFDMSLKAIKKHNVVDVVYDQIKANICNNIWPPGTKIPSEPKLADLFEVSRVSIRSAVQKLRDYGIVVTYQGKGTFVSEEFDQEMFNQDFVKPVMHLSESDFFDMLTFRKTVEFKCIQLAVKYATESDLEAMEKALSQMWLFTHEYKKYSLADYDFHLAIVKASHNSMFILAMTLMKDMYLYYLEEINRVFGISRKSIDAHREVYLAIAERNAEKAIQILDEAMGDNVDALEKFGE